MVTYVLDTSAVLRFLDKEPRFSRVNEILVSSRKGNCNVAISAVNWGELVYILSRTHDGRQAEEIATSLKSSPVHIEEVDEERARKAGLIKLRLAVPYADAFGIELAGDSTEHILVTADFDFKPAEQLIRIEFLLPKSSP